MKKKLFLVILIAICMVVPVMAYSYYYPYPPAGQSGYAAIGETYTSQNASQICAMSGLNAFGAGGTVGFEVSILDATTGSPNSNIWSDTVGQNPALNITKTVTVPSGLPTGLYFAEIATCLDSYPHAGRWWYYNVSNYEHEIIVNVKTSGGLNLPRTNVELFSEPGSSVSGLTGLDGNITFSGVNVPANYAQFIIAQKAGFNVTNFTPTWDRSTNATLYANIVMQDLIPPVGGQAIVYVDIADLTTGLGITGATAGIENTTATINQWYYYTEPTATANFTTTGIYPDTNNLSVGQTVVLSAYKSGLYVANNSGNYVIPSAISHTTLYLVPTSGNTSAGIYYPVTITDASTGYALSNSYLNTSLTTGNVWYNQTSATGKFNVTGTGSTGSNPISIGDQIVFVGTKVGYKLNYFSLIATAANSSNTQFLALVPEGLIPLGNETTIMFDVYDSSSTLGLNGATVSLSGVTPAKQTNGAGTLVYTNLTHTSYTYTVSLTGYTTVTGTANSALGSVTTVDVALSKSNINPTPTPYVTTTTLPYVTITTAANGSYTGFWAPGENLFGAMGASNAEMGILMAGFLIFVGFVCGGFGGRTLDPYAPFSGLGSTIGGIFAFICSIAFGFIPFVYVIVVIFMAVFAIIFFKKG